MNRSWGGKQCRTIAVTTKSSVNLHLGLHGYVLCHDESLVSPESQLEAQAESSHDKQAAASQQIPAESYSEVRPCMLSYCCASAWLLIECKHFIVLLQGPPVSSNSHVVGQNIITLAYQTGWPRVMMHYSVDSQSRSKQHALANGCQPTD